jgi:peptidoglycan/xylan/chitin deacetylase (PgdA/CDA1 family)
MSNRTTDNGRGSTGARMSAGIAAALRWPTAIIITVMLFSLTTTDVRAQPPLLVRAGRADTPATLAERYLDDAAKGWVLNDYNGVHSVSDGQPVLVPALPYRPGGLFPDGYQSIPVLVYDGIGNSSGHAGWISPSQFKAHMNWLKSEGFVTITPDQLAAFMDFSGQLPEKAIMITVDSQAHAILENAVAPLKELGMRATLFVATDAVAGEDALAWSELARLEAEGFTIGCRGRSGRSLLHNRVAPNATVHAQTLAAELAQAKQAIERHLINPCTALAWPEGDSNALLAAMAAKLGFTTAFVRSTGENPFFGDRFGVHRLVIDAGVTDDALSSHLTSRIKADLR